ncbi:MAG: MarR family winged helix-turn-helix transcriptional regulator [Lachnospiraceae bacterium]
MKELYESGNKDDRLIGHFREIGHTLRHISEGRGSQKRILMILDETGKITQSELTEKLRIQPGSASEVIGKLEAAGLLIRIPSEADRRTTDILLTEAGRAEAEEARRQRKEHRQQMFACLSKQEKQTLLELLEKINEAWEHQYPYGGLESGGRKGRRHHHGRHREK